MRRNNVPRNQTGMNEHLQLQDLDLELELLKRKREMIEQQQQMLTNGQSYNTPRPFEYGNKQPPPLLEQQPFGNSSGFSRYYSDPPLGFGGGALLGKRPMSDAPAWQGHSAPKRFSGPQGGSKKKFGGGPGPRPNNPQIPNYGPYPHINKSGPRQQWDNKPKSNFPSQKFNNGPKGPKPHKDYRPSKVSKPKPPQPGNKLISYPIPERKRLVQQANKSTKEDFTGDKFILRANVEPSHQVAGRLELALGNISKEIKAKYGDVEPYSCCFKLPFLTRKMKQSIRERVRGVMMGKPVGNVNDIVEHYRHVFPSSTDCEILDKALAETQHLNSKHLPIKLEGADNAFRYLKTNMNKILAYTLEDMFTKMKNIYEDIGEEKTKSICENIVSEALDFTKDIDLEEADKNASVEIVDGDGQGDKNEKAEASGSADNSSENIKENVSGDNANDGKSSNDKTAGEDKTTGDGKPTDNTPIDDNPTDGDKPADANKAVEAAKSIDIEKLIAMSQKPDWKKIDDLIVNLVKRRLPMILPKFKPQLLKILNASSIYQLTKSTIIDKTQSLIDLEKRIHKAERSLNASDNAANPAVTSTPNRNTNSRFAFVVKIHGRPALPKRKVMQTFLDEFKPTGVKKHRNMPMLYVGFNDREAFDKIVAVKETTLGNCTISIKTNVVTKEEETNKSGLNDSTDKIISSDLNDQIDDLLSSIRKEEETVTVEQSGDGDKSEAYDPEAPTDVQNDANAATEEADSNKGTTVPSEETTANVTETVNEGNEAVAGKDTANQTGSAEKEDNGENEEAKDKVEALKTDGKDSGRATPTRASSRLANVTPSSVKTRRASRLAQN